MLEIKELFGPGTPKDGTYAGLQSGYTVTFRTPEGVFKGKTVEGYRGSNIPVLVQVEHGIAYRQNR